MLNVARPEIEVRPSAGSVAERAAELLTRYVRDDVARHGRATLAMSGGRTPQRIFEILATTGLPWELVDFFQVDERIAPAGHSDRNATQTAAALAAPLRRHPDAFHWMPVEDADLDAAAQRYAAALGLAAGTPPNVGTVHLGRRRMTLTLAALNGARRILWVVTGADKQTALAGLVAGDPSVVASRVRRSGALILADADAAELI